MSRSSNRNLITPDKPAVPAPVNSQQIQQLITNTNEKDMLFYEYEIVDKEKEEKWARREARKYGLCLCSRWLFLLLGNTVLVALVCAICGILLYVNTPIDETVQPLPYGASCTTGSNNCDSVRYLSCVSNTCTCAGSRIWNGTDCICDTNNYWDGLACLTNQGYQQPCSSSLPCYSPLFSCDNVTNTCLCPKTQIGIYIYYTQYYTGGVTDLYSGVCIDKTTYQGGCSSVKTCQDYRGLGCMMGPGNYLQCRCYTNYYWSGSWCTWQGTYEGYGCSSNPDYACNPARGLYCDTSSNTCKCPTNYYYNNITGFCTIKGTIGAFCYSSTWCNTTLGLSCYQSGGVCNCGVTSAINTCDCTAGTHYWDGQKCTTRVGLNSPCYATYSCSAGTCLFGYCL